MRDSFMKEGSIDYMSQKAFSEGYMFKPVNVYGPEDRQRIENNISKMFSDQIMNDIMLYNIVDRLTYVRDYNVRKSINFMMTVKDKKGETIAFTEMVYSKNSEMLYVKKFKIDEGHNEKEVLSLAIKGAKDHLNDFGMKFNTIITSPQVGGSKKDLEVMIDLGMKFMAFTPKTDYGELNQATENIPSEENEIVLFPFKEQIEKINPSNIISSNKKGKGEKKIEKTKKEKMWNDKGKKLELENEILKEMHVLLIKKYGNQKADISEKKFRVFLEDVKEEEVELSFLFQLFKKEKDVKVTIRKMDEIEKLLLLFKNWEDKYKENEEPSVQGGKNIDKGILQLIKNLNKGIR
jgi:hypothetical protein